MPLPSIPLAPNVISANNTVLIDPTNSAQQNLLACILLELRTITYYLQAGLNVTDEPDSIRADLSSKS